MELILILILILLLIGGVPAGHVYMGWGYGTSGALFVVLLVILIYLVLTRMRP